MSLPTVSQHLLIEWLNGLARVPIGGRPVVRTGVQVSVFSGRLHRIPRTYPRFWAGLRALKLPIYPFFGPAYRPGPPRFIRTAGRPLCVYSGVLTYVSSGRRQKKPRRHERRELSRPALATHMTSAVYFARGGPDVCACDARKAANEVRARYPSA